MNNPSYTAKWNIHHVSIAQLELYSGHHPEYFRELLLVPFSFSKYISCSFSFKVTIVRVRTQHSKNKISEVCKMLILLNLIS